MKDKSYAQIAREFEPQTKRERKLKQLCKLACPTGSENGTCPCYSPLDCQLVVIHLNRSEKKDEV